MVEEKLIRIKYSDVCPIEIGNKLHQFSDSVFLIEDFPTENLVLTDFINQLGKPIKEYRNKNEEVIFEVKVEKERTFFKSFANTNYYFPLHTDCSDFEIVPNCVALHCIYPSTKGGESHFVPLTECISKLTNEEISFLKKKNWKFRKVNRPILSKNDFGYSICYNRIMIEIYSKLSNRELVFLNKFDDTLRQLMFQLKLAPKDLILFRNDRVLHGRNDFPENSKRLLKRIRFKLGQG